MCNSKRTSTAGAILALGMLLLAGCSGSMLTAPLPPASPAANVTAPQPPSRLASPAASIGGISPSPTLELRNWYNVTQVLVQPGEDRVISGSRYQLHFAKGSLSESELISINEYDCNVLDVQFGPHGTRFVTPVVLEIDFSGTKADPAAAAAEDIEPVLWYLNEITGSWEEVPGTTDWARRKHIVRLGHFSRYVLGGKAGWKHTPQTEAE